MRDLGEKLGANPVNGTGSLTIPLATSVGRSGFGPKLALSNDSGSENRPFSRKTDKGLPRDCDTPERRFVSDHTVDAQGPTPCLR